jgi:hypothetical protein
VSFISKEKEMVTRREENMIHPRQQVQLPLIQIVEDLKKIINMFTNHMEIMWVKMGEIQSTKKL